MTKASGPARFIAILSIIFGLIAIGGGVATWATVTSQLAAENITVPKDSPLVPGAKVQDPISAYAQAEIINHHALAMSGGKTYAELGTMITEAKNAGDTAKADELTATRTTLMNASFLRASLFTSVLAYGVSLLVVGLGLMFLLTGWALASLARPRVVQGGSDRS
ncbi:MAG: aromatic ring-opening dioxygenase LigA [Micropruina sp.]|uniref:aromatic ring-opening dioxygenase LigA n=1 Tax=Micropruina sp. TaxID=2737536 RepID=UPI0039E53629